MPSFAANLSMLWPELDVYDRFPAAATAGFSRVEILFVYPLDLDRVARLLRDHHLELVVFDPEPGDWEAGERGIASLPDRREQFQHSMTVAVRTAERLGVRKLNVLTGSPPASVTAPHQIIVENLLSVASVANDAGIDLLVENINDTDMPGYFVNTVERAAAIIADVNRPNIRLQFDQYHVGMMRQDARELFPRYADRVAHAQIADVPGRHQPGTGQQPIQAFLADLDRLHYGGVVGLEYRPEGPTEAALGWLPREQRR